jgi:hypothetical protein
LYNKSDINHIKLLKSIQLIKRAAIIESDKKFSSQVRVISLEDSSPYETLHSFVANTLGPYFKSYIKRGSSIVDSKPLSGGGSSGDQLNISLGGAGAGGAGGGLMSAGGSSKNLQAALAAGGDSPVVPSPAANTSGGTGGAGDQFATIMEKKIAEVEMGLLHLQQNIDIPEINLVIHPSVSQIIKKCAEEHRKPRPDDYADRAEDANFLNQLQSGVSRWIREIKKVIYFS